MKYSIRFCQLFLYCTLLSSSITLCQLQAGALPQAQPIGSAAVSASVVEASAADHFVTQTVYGFLDFTTTIGNTIMVFSPQSVSTTNETPTLSEQPPVIKEATNAPSTESVVSLITPSKPTEASTEKPQQAVPSSPDNLAATTQSSTLPSSITPPPAPSEIKNQPFSEPKILRSERKNDLDAKNNNVSNSNNKNEKEKEPVKVIAIKVLKNNANVTTKPSTKSTKPGKSTHKSANVVEIVSDTKTTKKVHDKSKTTSKSNHTAKTTPKNTQKNHTHNPTTPKTIQISSSKVEDATENKLTVITPALPVSNGDLPTTTPTQKTDGTTANDFDHTRNSQNTSSEIAEKKIVTPIFAESGSPSTEDSLTSMAVTGTSEEPAILINNNVSPEYDYLSRQPSAIVDETYKVIDVRPSGGKHNQKSKNPTNRGEDGSRPTGLLSSYTDSVIKDGTVTLYETKVIGTSISGKYAQVLQSSSHIIQPNRKFKPTAASTARILKTAAPPTNKYKAPQLESTGEPTETVESSENNLFEAKGTSKRPTKNRFGTPKNKYSSKEDQQKDEFEATSLDEEYADEDYLQGLPSSTQVTPAYKKSTNKNNKFSQNENKNSNKQVTANRRSSVTAPDVPPVPVYSESISSVTPSTAGRPRFQPSGKRTVTSKSGGGGTSGVSKRSFITKPKLIGTTVAASDNELSAPSEVNVKLKLSRPSGRWHYKTSPKPRVTIRRQDDLVTDNSTVVPLFTPDVQIDSTDQDLSASGIFPIPQNEDNAIISDLPPPQPTLTAETLRVEISTPANFKDIYYEIATIKSPYTFQVGNVKNTRFITVTSTFEKSLVQPTETAAIKGGEPLSENILPPAHQNAYEKEPPLDSSIATLPVISLASDMATPPLQTMTESFSTTQLMLKTHILPVVKAGETETSRYTMVQSYHVTRLVTATKTLPPMEMYQFNPTKTLNEFNTRLDEAGSEMHLDLDFADNNNQLQEEEREMKTLLADLDLSHIGSDFQIPDTDKARLLEVLKSRKLAKQLTTTPQPTSEAPTTSSFSPDQLQQLALLRLLNPNGASPPNVITQSKPIIKIETAYESYVIPIFNGASTYFTTISRPTATITKTDYEYATTTLPSLQPTAFNPFLPQQPQIMSTPVVTQTMVTETDSKILKLTFGAKTAYTTLFSTRVVPTVITTYLTNTINLQPTAAPFPSFYNPAQQYLPFPFLG